MNAPTISNRHVIVHLVRGPLYQEENQLWARLLREERVVRSHFHMMGLELVIDEDAGYAFLRNEQGDESEPVDEDSATEAPLPSLMRRTPLSHLPTVMLLELRERLLRHDQAADGTDHLYLDFKEILEFMQPYCDETGNEKKVEGRIRSAISRLTELSVLRQVNNRSDVIYRVEPILRAKLPIDQIESIRDRLKSYSDDPAPSSDASDTSSSQEPTNP